MAQQAASSEDAVCVCAAENARESTKVAPDLSGGCTTSCSSIQVNVPIGHATRLELTFCHLRVLLNEAAFATIILNEDELRASELHLTL